MSGVIEAGPAHAAALAAMHSLVFPHEPWDEAAFLSLLGQRGMLALIHEAGGFLLLRAVLDEAEILTIGTLQRRQGIGGDLLREGLRHLYAAGVRTVYLEVDTGNEAARALYARLGFEATGLRKAYYEDGGDALTMRLDLEGWVVQQS